MFGYVTNYITNYVSMNFIQDFKPTVLKVFDMVIKKTSKVVEYMDIEPL